MTEALAAEIAEAVAQLKAVLPTLDDVRIDRRSRAVLRGHATIESLVAYMRSHHKTPADILWKLGDMLDTQTPAEPVAAPTEPVAAPAAKKVATRPKTAKKAKRATAKK